VVITAARVVGVDKVMMGVGWRMDLIVYWMFWCLSNLLFAVLSIIYITIR